MGTTPSKKAAEAKPQNHLTECQFLLGHTNLVRLVIRVGDGRFASAADDGSVHVWENISGRPKSFDFVSIVLISLSCQDVCLCRGAHTPSR